MGTTRGRWATASVVALTAAAAVWVVPRWVAGAGATGPPARPRLVVIVTIDPFRADWVETHADLFSSTRRPEAPRGVRYLMERGAWYADARPDGVPPVTSHGASGLVADELKTATGGRAKVWGLALNERSAVPMAGRRADGAVWLDPSSGKWTTSSAYAKDGRLPVWAEASHPATTWTEAAWTTALSADALARFAPPTDEPAFPHALPRSGPRAAYFEAYSATALANAFVLRVAEDLLETESLGKDGVPDLLAIDLSSIGPPGRAFAPDGPESVAMTVETDRVLALFMDSVIEKTPGGWSAVTFVVVTPPGARESGGAGAQLFFAGFGVREPGRYRARVSTLDVAATLVDALGVAGPDARGGRRLPHAGR